MTLATPRLIADQFLMSTIGSDATITSLVSTRTFADVAPHGTQYPLIVFRYISQSQDNMAAGGIRYMSTMTYVVEAIGQTETFGSIEAIAERFHTLIDFKEGTVSRGQIVSCVRTSPFSLSEVDSATGLHYRRLGGTYRIQVQ